MSASESRYGHSPAFTHLQVPSGTVNLFPYLKLKPMNTQLNEGAPIHTRAPLSMGTLLLHLDSEKLSFCQTKTKAGWHIFANRKNSSTFTLLS